jgi:protein TonB
LAIVIVSTVAVRHILVPPDIVAVPRRTPVRTRKRTPWHPQPDGEVATDRGGGREWFSDKLFVESQEDHTRSGYGTSFGGHCIAAAVLVVVIVTRPVPILHVGDGSSPMIMPAELSILPITTAVPRAARVESTAPKPTMEPTTAPPPPPAGVSAPTPLEAPSDIQPETGAESGGDGVDGGVIGGVPGGVLGGTAVNANASGGAESTGPLRVGGGIKPPRKIKDVKPAYPPGVLAEQMRGTVVIEATIDTGGKVCSAKILHSVPALDQAALDAVRQWEYAPSLLDGLPVAVVFTVIVNFVIQ